MRQNDPKAADRFHSFRAGWRDANTSKDRDARFIMHATRPDLAKAYNEGYDAGCTAYNLAIGRAARRYKFTPSVLRATHTGGAGNEK